MDQRRARTRRDISRASSSIRAITITSWSPRSATCSTIRPIAASTSRRTAARRGSKTLYVGPQSGASDVAMDSAESERHLHGHLAVSTPAVDVYERRRRKTDSTSRPTAARRGRNSPDTGCRPESPGRIGLAVAPSDGNRVYALIESKDGILWRSDDGGDDWKMVSSDTLVDQRPFYFTHHRGRSEESGSRLRRFGSAVGEQGRRQDVQRDRRRRARRLPRDLDRAERSRRAS